ncbi:hypothetical protein D3C75_1220320 [compost metagenome]
MNFFYDNYPYKEGNTVIRIFFVKSKEDVTGTSIHNDQGSNNVLCLNEIFFYSALEQRRKGYNYKIHEIIQ